MTPLPARKRPRPPRRPPPTYQVEVVPPPTQDPKAARAVLAWLRSIGGLDVPPPKPVPVRVQLHALKLEVGHCQACQFTPGAAELSRALHVHHVVPRAKGGDHERENLLVLCARCHALAHAAFKRRKATWRRVLVRLACMRSQANDEGTP